jgi:uncharacterized protein YndB with AHSA1/START domain
MTTQNQPHNVVVTRVFDAPVEQVWQAWSDPDRVMQWWGPEGFTSPSAAMDFREGGTSLVCMRAPAEYGGMDMYNTWTYTKIVPNERLEFLLRFADKDGQAHSPSAMGLPPGIPDRVPHVITFKPLDAHRTEMTVTEFGYADADTRDTSQAGLEQCLDKMARSFK